MIVCRTERLVIRRFTFEDASFVLELVNEPSWIQNIGDRGVRSLDDARRYLENGPMASYARNGFGLCCVELADGSEPVGMCGLIKRDSLPDVDIGFALLPRFWSKGFALEAAAAMMRHGKETLGLQRIVAIVSPHNQPSIRLLGKLGLVFERKIRMPGEDEDIDFFGPGDHLAAR